ncbi:hypothetical protein ACFPK5_16420 [Streptomyces beijiangensis]|uniref:hypothetical protein n=1 Tax=Streptomyces beijiangensis TaxID=163361 RepID=UPI00360D9700
MGTQDLTGTDFASFGTVTTFFWLSPDVRGRGLGKEMRQTVLPSGLRRAGGPGGGQRRLLRQPRIEPRIPSPGVRAQRRHLGHPPRRGGKDQAMAADPRAVDRTAAR